MDAHQDVPIRERVKKPAVLAILESYVNPTLTRALAHHFELEDWIHLAHAQLSVRQGIIGAAGNAKIQCCVWTLSAAGPEAAGRLHTARSRNDLHVTTWRMTLRGQMLVALRGGVLATFARARVEAKAQAA